MRPVHLDRRAFVCGAAALIALPHGRAFAQAYPSRPVRMIVPFPAGGSVDQVARAVAELMARKLGQPVIVDNKAGANAAIGAAEVARSNPDGYTILFGSDSGLVLGPLLYKKLPYDAERDFAPVALSVEVPLVLTVNPARPFNTVAELVAYAKANPGKLNYSSTGSGSVYHLTTELFCQRTGIQMTHIPFTGGAPALNALLGNQVDLFFSAVNTPLQFIKTGKLRALAVLTPKRVPSLADVPTLDEAGYPGIDAISRYGVAAPIKTPREIVDQLNAAANFALSDPNFREKFIADGFLVPAPHSAADFDRTLRSSRAMWGKLIQAKGLSLD